MPQYQQSSSFCGSTEGYKIFCEKEKEFAALYYKYQNDVNRREMELKKFAEENKLKVQMKELENHLKQYVMQHEEEMERIAQEFDLKRRALEEQRETHREEHEERMKKIDKEHEIETRKLDIKKDEIAREDARLTKDMLLRHEEEKLKKNRVRRNKNYRPD